MGPLYKLCLSCTLLNKLLIQLLEQVNIWSYAYVLAGLWLSILHNRKFLGNKARGNVSPSFLETTGCLSQSQAQVCIFFWSITKRIENYDRTYFSIYYCHLRCPIEITDEFGIDSRTSESNARHFHLINSNQVQDESAVYVPGMPNVVFTILGYLIFRMKAKITLRKN